MQDISLHQLEKVRENYLGQMQDAKNRIYMLEGALQALDALIKLAKEEIKLDQGKPS